MYKDTPHLWILILPAPVYPMSQYILWVLILNWNVARPVTISHHAPVNVFPKIPEKGRGVAGYYPRELDNSEKLGSNSLPM